MAIRAPDGANNNLFLTLKSGDERVQNLDGCRHIYLDMGTNSGVQIRKLYQPHLFPNASVLPIFDKFFGPIGKRFFELLDTIKDGGSTAL